MRRFPLLVGLLVPVAVAACSGGDPSPTTPPPTVRQPGPDGGSDAPDSGDAAPRMDAGDAAPDAPAEDAGDAAVDAGDASPDAVDAGPPPVGKPLAQGSGLILWGITSEDLVAYSAPEAGGAQTVFVVPLAGGTPEKVATLPANSHVDIDGPALFLTSGAAFTACANASWLALWTKAGGVKPIGTLAFSSIGTARRTEDGAKVVYTETDGECQKKSIVVANADGTGQGTALLPSSTCLPTFNLLGNGAVATSSCSDPNGGLATHDTLTLFTAGTYAKGLAASATPQALDPKGSWIWASSPTGAQLLSTADGKARLTDPQAQSWALFDGAGAALYYVSGDALKRVALSDASAPTTLVASGVKAVESVSPDGKTVVFDLKATGPSGYEIDGVAAAGGKPWHLFTPSQVAMNGSFTRDGLEFLVAVGLQNAATVTSVPALGGSAKPVGKGPFFTLDGSRVLMNEEWASYAVVDAASGGKPAALIASADSLAVGDGGKAVVYTTSVGAPGLYVVAP